MCQEDEAIPEAIYWWDWMAEQWVDETFFFSCHVGTLLIATIPFNYEFKHSQINFTKVTVQNVYGTNLTRA